MAGAFSPDTSGMDVVARRLALGLLLLFLALLAYTTYLQVLVAEDISTRPENRRSLLKQAEQPRGAILSSDGGVLADRTPRGRGHERSYPLGALTAHITGYSSVHFGRSGLEARYNRLLSPATESGLGDRLLSLLEEPDTPSDLVLTLDLELQREAARALGDRRGAVVALHPRTGAVLALVSSPSYDPNPLTQPVSRPAQRAWRKLLADPDRPLLARATQELYPPGSTFKVVTAGAALEAGLITLSSRFVDRGSLDLPLTSHRIENFGGRAHGNLDLTRAFAVSSNVVFGEIGLRLGASRLVDQSRRLGLNTAPTFDLPLAASRIPPAGKLDAPATAMSAIGQRDVRVTPLQMALIAATVANGGTVPRPHIVAEVRGGRETRKVDPGAPLGRAFSSPTATTLTYLMERVVQLGSGRFAAISGVRVAGKTGTAQTGNGPPHLWFVAFAPAQDPTVAVAVLVEGEAGAVSEESTGGRVAAPIAKQVMAAALGRSRDP